VVVSAPPEADVVTFRDPVVLREGETWRMLVGGGLGPEDGHGPGTACVFGYESRDLLEWQYTGLVAARTGAESEPEWTGTKWECPQLVRLGEVDVLVVSVCDEERLHHVVAAPGRFADGRFTARTPWQRLTHGVPYAATAFAARDGRPALLTWLRDVSDPAAGWAGALGLPLSLGVAGDRVVLDLLVDPGGTLAWEPDADGFTVRGADGSAVAALTAEPGTVVLTPAHGGPGLRLPRGRGPVRVVADGPVLEVLHDGRYGAVPLRPPTAEQGQA
jgi:beta-fructofuranosidase